MPSSRWAATPFRLARMKEDKSAAAAILNLPYRILGSRAGLKFICDAVSEIGPYLSTTGFVLRPWAEANADTLVRYVRAYVGGLRWALDPQNKQAAVGLLADRLALAGRYRARSLRDRHPRRRPA